MRYPFSADGYRGVIAHARALDYRLIPMCESRKAGRETSTMILRHDVDLSLGFACEMAILEAELGVKSTYFILLQNEYYDPFSTAGAGQIREIVALGHEIGLHWDSSSYDGDVECMRQDFKSDCSRLAEISGAEIVSASQHIPIDTPYFNVSELIPFEAYSPVIAARYRYVSDSAMAWRDVTVWDLIDTGIDIQFLAHPVWWMTEGVALRDKLDALKSRNLPSLHPTIDAFAEYVERCLIDREKLDDALSVKWANRKI